MEREIVGEQGGERHSRRAALIHGEIWGITGGAGNSTLIKVEHDERVAKRWRSVDERRGRTHWRQLRNTTFFLSSTSKMPVRCYGSVNI